MIKITFQFTAGNSFEGELPETPSVGDQIDFSNTALKLSKSLFTVLKVTRIVDNNFKLKETVVVIQ